MSLQLLLLPLVLPIALVVSVADVASGNKILGSANPDEDPATLGDAIRAMKGKSYVTVTGSVSKQIKQDTKASSKGMIQLEPMLTIFNNRELLEKTLREHGVPITTVSENTIVCELGAARLEYIQPAFGEPFILTVSELENFDQLIHDMECFEREYRQNVQSYTYTKLQENLVKRNMRIARETLLEDNSILITIDI